MNKRLRDLVLAIEHYQKEDSRVRLFARLCNIRNSLPHECLRWWQCGFAYLQHAKLSAHEQRRHDYHEKHARGTKEGQMEATQVPHLMTM